MIGIQIYCRRPSLGEVSELLSMGVTHIAWDTRPDDGERLVLSRQIADRTRECGQHSALLVHTRKPSILEAVARMVRPDYLLLSSDRDEEQMPSLAKRLAPATMLMMSVPVPPRGRSAGIDGIARAREYSGFAGALTIDTIVDPTKPLVFGCTGATNDWGTAAEIVRAVAVPVVLAGGLNPENVEEAILSVRPAVVDACTSLEWADKSKNLERCRDFVAAAKRGGEKLAQESATQ